MRWNSIRNREMLILILACILVVLILGGIWLYTTREYIKNDIYSSDIQDSRHMVESVSMYLDDIIHNVDIISHSPDTVTSLRGNDTKGLKQIADNLNMSTPKPDAIVIIDNNGQILYGTRSTNLTNITQYYWYNDMAKSKGAYITGLYNSAPLKDYAFAILTPVQNNGTIIGRIMAVFTPESFQDSLKEHNLDPRDNIIVVDSHGDVISSNDLTVVNRNTDLSSYSPIQKVIRGESGLIVHNDSWDGQPRISAYKPIPDSGWGVIVSTPESIEYKPLYDQMKWIIGILLFFVGAFSILGYYISKYLTDPIVKLSDTMKRISAGDHDIRVKIERKDEIGDLAKTFDSMMDKLEDAKSLSDMYVDLMGHDINNMNQVALGYLELADGMIGSGETLGKSNESLIRKPISVLEDSSKLIDNVRKLQRVKSEELQKKTVDITEILTELKDKSQLIPGRDVKIDFEPSGSRLVSANELIIDIFLNLIWNAIKHSDPKKPLVINLGIDEIMVSGKRYYKVAVEDNGPGIKDELKPKLFSRFSRGETKAKGSGLGLYLVKSLVEKFQGSVWVEDRVSGDHTMGARFVVMLPAIES